MRRFLLLFATVLSTCIFASAAEADIPIAGNNFTKDPNDATTATYTPDPNNGFTFTLNKGGSTSALRLSDTDHLRIYAQANFTIASNNGETITKIEFYTLSGYSGKLVEDTGVNGMMDGDTWTGKSSSVTFKATAQSRINQVKITYDTGGLSFTPDEITINYGDEVPAFTLNNPGKVKVTWSSSREDVATVDQDGVVTVNKNGVVDTTIITATEIGNESNKAVLTLTVNPIAGNISYFATTFVVIKDKDKDAEFVAPVLTNPNGLTVTYTSNSEVAMVDENTGYVVLNSSATGNKATITAKAAKQGIYAESTASYTIEVKEAGAPETKPEVLDIADFGSPDSYSAKEYTNNGITYWGVLMKKSSSEAIQINSSTATINGSAVHHGIVVKANESGYVLRKITIKWDGLNTDDIIDVYGRTSAFVSTDDMWESSTLIPQHFDLTLFISS